MSAEDSASTTNAISFDVEHWHSATLLSDAVEDPEDRIEESVDVVLDVLRRHDVRATFFVVGEVASEYPDVVRKIADAEHELASHGHTHTPLFELSPDAFERELDRSTTAIERASGIEPVGFRAPNFSVTGRTDWALSILESNGYRYDSSVFPVTTPMYGVSGAPIRPYDVALDDPFHASSAEQSGCGLVEVPLSVLGSRVRLPIAGGFYGRVTPVWLLERGIRRLNRRGIPATLYFHPWEFNPAVRVDSPSVPKRFVSFVGIEKTARKLDRLLTAFDFGPIRAMVDRRERNPKRDKWRELRTDDATDTEYDR
ncbi:polysaccharide deacetylase family protein [Halorarum halophilum]|uniref:polysaccharide deacetylase family protein n=1 Tax=Halorarum halophilum TaxID=2743090 RepID=UPI001FEC2E9F|nr:polysaccharide deacetylase family protein [Halobaculum halophilum]